MLSEYAAQAQLTEKVPKLFMYWWRTQDRKTKIIITALTVLLAAVLCLRIVLQRNARDYTATKPPEANRPISTGTPSAPPDEDPVPCPPDEKILEDYLSGVYPTSGLYGHLCVDDYIAVWAGSPDAGYDPTLLLMKVDQHGSLDWFILGMFGGLAANCEVYESDLAFAPRRIVEYVGCQYWGRIPPADSPHVQVVAQQNRLFAALTAMNTREVCAMLGDRALRRIEETGRKCEDSQKCLEFQLRHLVAPQDLRLVQATREYAVTAGDNSQDSMVILNWKNSGAAEGWQVSDLYEIGCEY